VERHEAIELLEPLVDGEVSEEKEREVLEFLSSAPDCRREYERLSALSRSIRENLPQIEAPPYLRRRVEQMANQPMRQSFVPRLFGHRWAQTVTVSLLAATLVLVLLNWESEGEVSLSMFVLDHMEYAQQQEVTELKSGDLVELESWFKARLPFTPQLPALPALLEGGRLCHIGEERVALAFYNWDGNRISLFVGDAKSLRISRIRGILSLAPDGVSFGSERGHSAAVWTKSGLTYVIVVACPEKELKEFVEVWRSNYES